MWDWRRGEVVAERQIGDGISELSYTVDGSAILLSDGTGTIHQIDSDTLEGVGPAVDVSDMAGRPVAPGPDGQSAVVAS